MLKNMHARVWIAISGIVWFLIGAFLLYKGLALTSQPPFVAMGLVIGFLKGNFVLAKTVRRVVKRLVELPKPIRFKDAYSPAYWMIIAFMMSLGMCFRFFAIPPQIHGTIDIAIGFALINGSRLYFKSIYGSQYPAQSP